MTESGKTIGDAIVIIADKMQMPAEHIFEVIVKAQPLIGILNIITGIIVIITYCVAAYLIFKHWCAKHTERFGKPDVTDWTFISFISGMIAIVPTTIVLMVCSVISDGIISIYMPEYAAIRVIAHIIGAAI